MLNSLAFLCGEGAQTIIKKKVLNLLFSRHLERKLILLKISLLLWGDEQFSMTNIQSWFRWKLFNLVSTIYFSTSSLGCSGIFKEMWSESPFFGKESEKTKTSYRNGKHLLSFLSSCLIFSTYNRKHSWHLATNV